MAKKDKPLKKTEDDKILEEAQERFKRCQDWENDFQKLYREDVKFANGDSDNGWQWPNDIKQGRGNKRPMLTINKVSTKVAAIVNEGRENKASISIKPVGDQTDYEAAQICEGVVRHIEYASKAQTIYDESLESATEGGIGWWRVGTQFDSDDFNAEDEPDVTWFDQSILILPVRDHLGVYLDPDIEQKDGSDAMFGFLFRDVPREEAEKRHPSIDFAPMNNKLSGPDSWARPHTVREAEYYRIVMNEDELIYMEDEGGNTSIFFRSSIPDKWRKRLQDAEKNEEIIQSRKVMRKSLEWYKIIGDQIVDRRKLKGRYVPLVRTIGVERIIDGKLYRRGHVRPLKDPQRMYNYNSSGQVEFGALQTKTPWVGPRAAFEGNEDIWNRANLENLPYITYNHWDPETEQLIPKPERPAPPGSSPVFVDGMRIAEHEMDMASGQYEAVEGRSGNERSGKAIQERARPSDRATYHFVDHQAMAIRYTGMIILDMLPHYYDTERVIKILGKDGVESSVTIKPDLEKAVEIQKDKDVMNVLFNPRRGRYMVQADVGPAYGTQRQEAWNAFVQIVTGAPDLINEIGDLMFRSADFPLADKIAERLMRKIKTEKPYLFDENAPTPMVMQLQGQVKELSQQVEDSLRLLAENRLKLVGKEQKRDIEAYRAESQRVKDVSNAQLDVSRLGDPELMVRFKTALAQALDEMFDSDLSARIEEIGGEPHDEPIDIPDMGLGEQQQPESPQAPPVEGARQAPDGKFYIENPNGQGYLRIDEQQ